MSLPLVVRIDVHDCCSAEQLKLDGWREIEILETWAGMVWKPRPADLQNDWLYPLARRAIETDLPACIEIARKAFIYDRLHADPEVPKEVADQEKENWIRRIFAESKPWVLEWDGKLAGFVELKYWRGDDKRDFGATVDLIAIDPECRGHAIGQRLIRTALNYADASGADSQFMHLRAGTQEKNEPARKFYRALGMNIVYRRRTFHKSHPHDLFVIDAKMAI